MDVNKETSKHTDKHAEWQSSTHTEIVFHVGDTHCMYTVINISFTYCYKVQVTLEAHRYKYAKFRNALTTTMENVLNLFYCFASSLQGPSKDKRFVCVYNLRTVVVEKRLFH